MANERLRSRIAAAGLTLDDVARQVKVDPKTVERWISTGRVPHRTHRWKTASIVKADEAYLWPEILNDDRTNVVSEAEFLRLYPHRGAVPAELWLSLIDNVTDSLDLLAFGMLFLPDSHYPEMARTLTEKGEGGVRVRLLLGDPNGDAVTQRGAQEGIGDAMVGRVQMAIKYLSPAVNKPGVEIRLHNTTLYNSIYRSDTTMLVNTHAYGSPAAQSPVLHLQRVPGGRLFDHYQQSFDKVWSEAHPLELDAAGTTGRRKKST